ncbi:MAG: hypothetical protein ACRD1P_11415, partial [Thermoanaerobaculia bacterium]
YKPAPVTRRRNSARRGAPPGPVPRTNARASGGAAAPPLAHASVLTGSAKNTTAARSPLHDESLYGEKGKARKLVELNGIEPSTS